MRWLTIAVGVLEWTVAIASVAGTLGLVGWILKMILQKDKTMSGANASPTGRSHQENDLD